MGGPGITMPDFLTMWRHTRMVTLTAVCAAAYAALLIPTQAFPLIPGLTNLRPGAAVAFVFSLLFGPAGAWGVAFGNTINDLFGTFGIGTLFGFAGNFLLTLLPYKIHAAWGSGRLPPSGLRGWSVFAAAVLAGSSACALVIGWGLHLIGIVPFAALAPFIVLNNTAFGLALSPPLLAALAPRVRAWGLNWEEIVEPDERRPRRLARPLTLLAALLAIGGLALGLWLSVGVEGQAAFQAHAVAASSSLGRELAVVVVLLVAACLLL